MLRLILSDLKLLTRQKLSILVFAVGLICALLAAASGAQWIEHLQTARAEFLTQNAEREAEFRERFARPDWTDVDSADAPYTARRAFAYPLPVLADFTVGRSHLEPTMAQVKMGYRSDTLFKNYQLDNPDRLQKARLDLSFVAIVIAPLLLIGLGFGLLSTDRDRGTARLILAQAGGPGRLLVARSISRVFIIASPIAVAAVVLLSIGPDIPGRLGAATHWLLVAFAGLLFWWAIILLVNATRAKAETATLILVALWTLLVFVAPPLIDTAAQSIYPPPSRMQLIVASRLAEQDAKETYANDHPTDGLPELQRVKDVIAEFHRITLAHEKAIGPTLEAFDVQLEKQQAFTANVALFSPLMKIADALAEISETNVARYGRLRKAAVKYLHDYHAALSRGIQNNRLYTLADHDALPAFTPPAAPQMTWFGVIFTAALITALGVVAILRFRNVQTF